MYFLPQLILIFWSFHILQRMFFSLYFWQLKEYRIDRFLEGASRNKEIVFPKVSAFALILFLIYFISLRFAFLEKYFIVLFFFFYLLFGIRALYLFSRRRWRFPKMTKKMILIIILTLFLFWFLVWFIFSNNFKFILIFEIFFSIFIFLCLRLIETPAFFAKKYIIFKAKQKINKFKDLIVIGIVGSYGKTSTKEFLNAFLSKKYNVLKTSGNVNTEIGIAGTILQKLKKEHQIFICEMGAYKKGEIKNACNIVKPKIGIVTGVNEQHLALFGSLDNLLSAEGGRELAEILPKDGILVLNGDNKYSLGLYKKWVSHSEPTPPSMLNKNINSLEGGVARFAFKIYSISKNKINSDIWTEDIMTEKDFISFVVISKNKEMAGFKVDILGKHNVQNILAAILAAKELGVSFEEISKACKNIKQEQAGMTLKKGWKNLNIIDSSYSANPDGVKADLEYLNVFPRKKVIVMPCLIELGGKSKEIHEKIGRNIAKICDLAIITTKERFKDIKKGAMEYGMKEKNIVFCENPNDIYTMITLFCKDGDSILLEGRVPGKLTNLLVRPVD